MGFVFFVLRIFPSDDAIRLFPVTMFIGAAEGILIGIIPKSGSWAAFASVIGFILPGIVMWEDFIEDFYTWSHSHLVAALSLLVAGIIWGLVGGTGIGLAIKDTPKN